MQVLALDVGVPETRAAVVDAEAGRLASAVVTTACDVRHPAPDAAEVDAEELWARVASAARQATREFPSVAAIAMSVQAPLLVLLDKTDRPQLPIWTAEDRRARPAARQVWAGVGDEFLETTGTKPLPGTTSAVQFRQQLSDDPYLGHLVKSYLHLNGWLALRMTGERAFDPANASRSGLFGTLADRLWSSRWCDYFEVEKGWLPQVVDATATVGGVRTAVAAELGVAAGIPVKLGTLAPAAIMLGARMTSDDLLHEVGEVQTLSAIVPASNSPPRASAKLVTQLLGIGAAYVQIGYNPVGGPALKWIRELCFQDQSDAKFYNETLPAAKQNVTSILFDPPHLSGTPLEIEAYRAAFRDLTLSANRDDLLTAVVQAMVRGHQLAVGALGLGREWKRVLMGGVKAEIVKSQLDVEHSRILENLNEMRLRGISTFVKGT